MLHSTDAERLIRDDLIRRHGWRKGIVLFGAPESEHSVKVATALELICGQGSFPAESLRHVHVTFTERAFAGVTGGGGVVTPSVGVWSFDYRYLTDHVCTMPAVFMDGKLHTDSGMILRMLAERFPDPYLPVAQRKEVSRWIEFNMAHSDRIAEVAKHWGWCTIHGSKRKNYRDFGEGRKDLAWERAAVSDLHRLLQTLDSHFAAKENKAYYVGNRMTLADCALLNLPWTLSLIVRLDIKKRYPNLWAHAIALKAAKPPGTRPFYSKLPAVARRIAKKALWQRGIFSRAFHIENARYWGTAAAARSPLLELPPPFGFPKVLPAPVPDEPEAPAPSPEKPPPEAPSQPGWQLQIVRSRPTELPARAAAFSSRRTRQELAAQLEGRA